MAEPVTRFYSRFYDSPVGKIAILTMDNGQDHRKPNTFGEAAMQSLNEALDSVMREADVRGLLLTGKPYIFAAGADLTLVPFITSFDQAYRIGKLGHTAMKRIMDLPFPTVAAINGVALGGGLEIALYCRYRTVARSVPAIGFPECFLGLIPGWGGSTLTTRLLGPEKALQLIVFNALSQNRTIDGPRAFEMGLVDRIFDGAEFLDESLQFLQDIIAGTTKVERPPVDSGAVQILISKARAFVDGKVHGASPAPYRALELIEGAGVLDVERGFEAEDKALGDLIPSRQCKAAIYSFDLVNRYAKRPQAVSDAKPARINKVGIIGAGLMASQLAHLFIHRLAVPVVMKDVRKEFVERGCAHVRGEFKKMVEKGKLSEGKARYFAGLLKGTLSYEAFSDCDFVIEAVFEQPDVKREVFSEVEEYLRPDAILATNTSSLSVTRMAEPLDHPQRLLGFHFFNPVAVMPLVEIVKAEKTNELTLATAFDLSMKLKKTGILVKDSPAFLVNRILLRMLSDSLSLADEGGSFQEVDEALLALGLPMAPFELLGLVGPAVAYHATETLNGAFGSERFPLNENFKKLVDQKKPGFYLPDVVPGRVDPDVEKLWVRRGGKTLSAEEIRERILRALAIEADLILREGVVKSPKDVDLAMIMGAGWPFFMGGLTMYLDLSGVSVRVLGKTFFNASYSTT